MRFWGCSFIKFYNDDFVSLEPKPIDTSSFIEKGFCEIPDNFENELSLAEWEFAQVVIEKDSWYVIAYDNDVEIRTRDIKYEV
jgi:hypothetical protein